MGTILILNFRKTSVYGWDPYLYKTSERHQCMVGTHIYTRLALGSPAGKGLNSWLSFVVSTVSHFPIGILGQVWYLIVSIPDLCTLTYFYFQKDISAWLEPISIQDFRKTSVHGWDPYLYKTSKRHQCMVGTHIYTRLQKDICAWLEPISIQDFRKTSVHGWDPYLYKTSERHQCIVGTHIYRRLQKDICAWLGPISIQDCRKTSVHG